ncbi:ABC transporter permease [Anaerosporobacter faecicola]|uniref:ABC transporter permease n=1 Tax=Anaerosporobacter faecicola TaxID=2718714 RepID=UPI0014389C7D|nr:ABC transporter permease [Anaerosporobacter faecicola]
MKEIGALIKRNMIVYCKDKSNLFFSFLTMFIVIALQLLFLGDMNVDNAEDMLMQSGLISQSTAHSYAVNLVYSWVVAGIVAVNAIMVTNNVLGVMVNDEDKKRMPSFYVAPIKRAKLILGYSLTAVIMGVLLSLVTVILSEIILVCAGGTLLSFIEWVKVFGIIVIHVFCTASFVFLLCLFVHTASAFSGLSTVIGTLIGFTTALYIPMGTLPKAVQDGLKCFPMLHASSMLREVFTKEPIREAFAGANESVIAEYKEYMGISIKVGANTLADQYKMLIIIGSGIIFLLISLVVVRKRRVTDR